MPSEPGFELVTENYFTTATDPDFVQEALARQIVLELISSFFLAATTQFETEFIKYMEDRPRTKCDMLVSTLVRFSVYLSVEEGRIAVVPALISRGLLFHWPLGYKAEKGDDEDPLDDKNTWDDDEVCLHSPPRAFRTNSQLEKKMLGKIY